MNLKRFVPIVLSVSILVTACGSGAEDASPASSTGNEPLTTPLPREDIDQPVGAEPSPGSFDDDENAEIPEWLLADSNPLHLELTLDEVTTSSADIGPEGGSLILERSDGTVFTLQIPEGALFSTETIKMTNVSEMSGINIETGTTYLVNLEPEDLLFVEPVNFSIEFPDLVNADEITGFSTDGYGENFHLIPSQLNGNRMETVLTHFTASGAFYASRGALAELQASYTPTSAEARAMEQLSTIDFAIDDEVIQKQAYERILSHWMGYSILPTMTVAADDDQLLATAVGEFLAWDQQVYTLSRRNSSEGDLDFLARFDDEYAAIYDAMALAFKNAIERAYTNCVQNKDPFEALNLTSWSLLATNFALDIFGMHGLDAAYIAERARRCVSFDFLFSSTVDGRGADGNRWKTQVSANVKLELDEFEFGDNSAFGLVKFFENIEILHMDDFSVVAPPLPPGSSCQYNENNGELSVNLGMPFTLFREERSFDNLILYMGFPQFPREQIRCLIQGIPSDFDVEFWLGMYSIAFDVGVSGEADQVLPRPLKYYKEDNAYVVHLQILNEGGLFAQGREAGPLNNTPEIYVEALYTIHHTPQ